MAVSEDKMQKKSGLLHSHELGGHHKDLPLLRRRKHKRREFFGVLNGLEDADLAALGGG